MENAIGKALRDARLKKGLTPEEVAKATRIRADWISDLENEDYHRFPSLGYARNFQILYAKFLEVDLQRGSMIDPGKMVLTTSFDHIYDGVDPIGYRGSRRPKPIRRSRWLLLIIIFSVACVVGAITALFILDILRLPGLDEDDKEQAPTEERLVVPPSATGSEPDGAPLPSPAPQSEGDELPPLSGDGTMHPPQPSAPEPLYKPSPRLQQLLPPAPPAADDASSGDEEMLNVAFPLEPSGFTPAP